ncbi:hypothetical protein BAZMOX_293061_1 [methanotrophic endosymbiont of Bathymodiolus azoricus (Menez Gwen)]|nr:hypothetical protein BAZMOX_293061_1 [methanotrophic endosymbiont of Bathymodiolus azoricus (Menez Gwen)]
MRDSILGVRPVLVFKKRSLSVAFLDSLIRLGIIYAVSVVCQK